MKKFVGVNYDIVCDVSESTIMHPEVQTVADDKVLFTHEKLRIQKFKDNFEPF